MALAAEYLGCPEDAEHSIDVTIENYAVYWVVDMNRKVLHIAPDGSIIETNQQGSSPLCRTAPV